MASRISVGLFHTATQISTASRFLPDWSVLAVKQNNAGSFALFTTVILNSEGN